MTDDTGPKPTDEIEPAEAQEPSDAPPKRVVAPPDPGVTPQETVIHQPELETVTHPPELETVTHPPELETAAPAPELVAEAARDPRLGIALREVEVLQAALEMEKGKRKKKKKDKDGLGTTRGIETMFRTSYRTHIDLSGLADSKANIMISINGIIISVVLAAISPKLDANPWLLVPTVVLLVGCVSAVIYAVLAARPRVSTHTVTLEDIRDNRANILFFGNFVSMEEDDFVDGMRDLIMDPERLYTNMIRDIYSLGGVLAKKFRLLRISYNLFMISLVVGVALFVAVFIGVAMFDLAAPLDPGF